MADKLPLVIDSGVVEQLQSGDVLINQEGTVIWAAAGFGTDNVVLRSDGTEFGSQKSDLSITDLGQLVFGQSPFNVIIGTSATGDAITTGVDNMLIGGFAGSDITEGIRNMCIGGSAGGENIDGDGNCCVGFGSLFNVRGDNNVAIGNLAGLGLDVSAGVGVSTTTDNNTFIGANAGNDGSQKDDAVNSMALGANTFTTADNQVVIGNTSITETILRGVVEGDSGTFVYAPSDLAVDNSIVRAAGTGVAVQTSGLSISDTEQLIFSGDNVIIGDADTGREITTGANNFLIGQAAGTLLEDGDNNYFLGFGSGSLCVSGDENTGTGANSLHLVTGDSNVAMGSQAGDAITTGRRNIFIGAESGSQLATGQLVTVIDSIAIGFGVVTTASNQMILGPTTITDTKIRGVVELKQTTALETSGAHLPILQILDSTGADAFEVTAFTNASNNVAMGRNAGKDITTATGCTCIGARAGEKITTGGNNFCFGWLAGALLTTGLANSYIGTASGRSASSGSGNTGIGESSLNGLLTGQRNVGIGTGGGRDLTTGINNVFIGHSAGDNASQKVDADNSIGIGFQTFTTADNQVVIGNTSITETILRGQVFTGDGAYETLKRTAKTSSASITTETLVLVDATSGDVTITLPPAANLVDTPVHLKKIDSSANSMIIEGDGSETIDGQLNVNTAVQYTNITVVSDGTSWFIL